MYFILSFLFTLFMSVYFHSHFHQRESQDQERLPTMWVTRKQAEKLTECVHVLPVEGEINHDRRVL